MLKKIFKNRIFLCVLTALIVGTTSVYAVTYFPSNDVTYDNSTSGLKSSDVQGAIDELYSTCSSAMAAGNYLYYSVNTYTIRNGSFNYQFVMANGANLYRCNLNGGNCSSIISVSGSQSIGAMYSTADYLYYAVNNYTIRDASFNKQFVMANGANLYRCNLNGENCSSIISVSGSQSVGKIYSAADYLYYSVNNYTIRDASFNEQFVMANGANLYRCNLNGDSCTSINSYNGTSSIN